MSNAYNIFENVITNSSDKDLEEAVDQLNIFKEKYIRSYRGIYRIPFVRDMFDILEDEYGYRNSHPWGNEWPGPEEDSEDLGCNQNESREEFKNTEK